MVSRKAHSQSKTLPKPLYKPITDKISGKYKFGLAKSRFDIWNSIDVNNIKEIFLFQENSIQIKIKATSLCLETKIIYVKFWCQGKLTLKVKHYQNLFINQ